jgi:periplasmic divalent cation tolerance protein
MNDVVIVLTTVADDDRAELLARQLVEERLAACANLHPAMTSIYRWKGRIERDAERQLVIKTTRDRVDALQARLRELHSYELPEFLVLDVAGSSQAYASWVAETTGKGGEGG